MQYHQQNLDFRLLEFCRDFGSYSQRAQTLATVYTSSKTRSGGILALRHNGIEVYFRMI